MSANKFLALDANGNYVEIVAIVTSGGVVNANEIPSTGADGRLDISFMPTGIGADTISVPASEALQAGAWVNLFNVGGIANARNANATDATKPVCGFVLAAVSQGSPATVYVRGINNAVPIGSILPASIGQKAFLDISAGGTSITPPSATGNYMQALGPILAVDTVHNLVTVNFSFTPGVTRG